LREIIERGLEVLEDYFNAADVLNRLGKGTEKVYTASEVRKSLALDD